MMYFMRFERTSTFCEGVKTCKPVLLESYEMAALTQTFWKQQWKEAQEHKAYFRYFHLKRSL